METVGEPLAFHLKSLKLSQSIPAYRSLSVNRAEKNSISGAAFGYLPDDAVNSIAVKTSPCLAKFNAAIRPENRCD